MTYDTTVPVTYKAMSYVWRTTTSNEIPSAVITSINSLDIYFEVKFGPSLCSLLTFHGTIRSTDVASQDTTLDHNFTTTFDSMNWVCSYFNF